MAIQQTKRQSDLEKRLYLLRRQIYGKDKQASYHASKISSNQDHSIANKTSDIADLHQDLLKILLFSSLAVGIQVILFILSQKHILNLNF